MSNDIYRLLETFCNEFEYTFHEDYSGRGMYGDKCPAISARGHEAFRIGMELGMFLQEEADDAEYLKHELVSRMCQDQLGLGIILYFPGL